MKADAATSTSMSRTLYLDGVPEKHFGFVTRIDSRASIEGLYSTHFCLENSSVVTLDCRPLNPDQYNLLLKFFEEYRGPIIVFAIDPVPPAVLSRFTSIEKLFTPIPRTSLVATRIARHSRRLRAKVLNLYKLENPDEPEDEESLT